jgi:exonuclease III
LGKKAKEIGGVYKIIYLGRTSTKNGVGVILGEKMKNKVVDERRKSDRIIMVKLIFEERVLNVISVYVLQVGCKEREKEEFWQEMDEVMQ